MNIYGYNNASRPTDIASPLEFPNEQQNAKAGSANFASLLQNYTEQMVQDHNSASKAAVDLATGKGGNTAETLVAVQKASLSFEMMMSVRNKLVDAYREVIRMQV